MVYSYVHVAICDFQIETLSGNLLRSIVYFDALTKAQQDVYRCTAKNTVGRVYDRINLIALT